MVVEKIEERKLCGTYRRENVVCRRDRVEKVRDRDERVRDRVEKSKEWG